MRRAVLRTWLQRPDITFLLPAEASMREYLRQSAFYSLLVGLIQLLVILFLAAPLFYQRWADKLAFWEWTLFLVVLFVWNLGMSWLETKSYSPTDITARIASLFRSILNFWLILILLLISNLWWLLSWIVPILYTVFAYQRAKETPFPWNTLVEEEAAKRATYYRWVEMLVDLPYTPKRVTQQNRLVRLFQLIFPSTKQTTHLFLFSRILLRNREFYSQYFLLPIWALLLSWAIPLWWVQYGIFLLGLFFFTETIFKMVQTDHLPLHYHLLPLEKREKRHSLQVLTFSLTLLFASWLSMLFAITTLFTPTQSVIALLLGLGYSIYVQHKARNDKSLL
jgi:predicted ABC-type exoprotein transport system permease subunit